MNSYYYDDYKITELSYFEYKNLVKNLISAEENKIADIFERLISSQVKSSKELHIGDKIKILIILRSIILGEEIQFSINGKQFLYDTNQIIDSVNIKNEKFEYKDMIFNIPKQIYYKNKFDCLVDNFYSFKIKDDIKIIENFSFKEKEIILQNLLGFEVKELSNNFDNYISNFYINYINETEINLYDSNMILFLKSLFETDLNEMYDIEYSIMNYLKFDPSVFNMYGLPELRIFLNKFIKEKEESKKQEGGNTDLSI
ncbi:MAG: hypothetical protein CML17_11355 [Pusillimonas sp.]|nr:hypothetical protein [Pusillimonas sp.]